MAPLIGAIKKHPLLVAACALFFVGGMLLLNDLSVYTPDSCRYLIWGNSLAHGHGYLDSTQPDPDKFVVHAPLYALLIAPVELFFPMSLIAVKVWTLLWGVLALILLYFWILPVFGRTAAICSTLILALNPAMLFFSTQVLSEGPFIVFVLLIFILLEKILQPEAPKAWLLWLFIAMLSIIPLLRETGIALVAAILFVFVSRRQRKRAVLVFAACAVVFGLWYIRNQILVVPKTGSQFSNLALVSQHFVTPADSPIANEFALRIWISLKTYAGRVGGLFFYPLFTRQLTELIVEPSALYRIIAAFFGVGKYIVLLAAVPLIGAGLASDLRSSPTASERILFAVLYVLAICLYPVHDVRFLLPLCPLVCYYLAGGVLLVVRHERAPVFLRRTPVIAAAGLLLMLPNIVALEQLVRTNLEYERSPDAILQHATVPAMYRFQWDRLKSWMDGHISDSAVIGSPIKDIVVVAGARKVLEIDRGVTLPVFESLLRDYHVEYLLAPPRWIDLREYEFLMRESRRFWFEPLPGAPNLMRVHSRCLEPVVLSPPHQSFDTASVTELLREGRSELANGQYERAGAVLHHALQLAPGAGDVLYQVMIADLFLGDSAGARGAFQGLLGQPQAFSYVGLARTQFDAADILSKARSSKMFEEQAVKTYKAASMYWKTGYYHRAKDLMNTLMETDTVYFVGLLWGFHFNIQLGDTVTASRYLSILANIDSTNPVVIAFEHILAIGDSLKLARSSAEKSALHMSAARICRTMQLFDESFDEAEMALSEKQDNTDALLLLARMFEQRSKPRRAMEMYRETLRRDAQNSVALARLDSLRVSMAHL